MVWSLYLLALAALLVTAPSAIWEPGTREFLVIIGLIGLWRYSWWGVHLVRAHLYRNRLFPRWRRKADLLWRLRTAGSEGDEEQRARTRPRVFVVITSYRIPSDTTLACYRSVFQEAERYGGEVVVVASLVESADERFVKTLFRRLELPERVRLVLLRLSGRGKRRALATALRAVVRHRPKPTDAVVVMDGDALFSPGTLARCLPFFDLFPELGGLTTDEEVVWRRGSLFEIWQRLRFAQRHLTMSSLALSRRLLTMTGRMSIFRASIATDPDFIRVIEQDRLEHWRLGRVPLLTGEDKSTWFWLLERGFAMLYVPDVRVWTLEDPPARSFLRSSTQLMLRWFGNMLRGGRKALALGPRRVGTFVWWTLVDQRVAMWTPLIGPTAALLLGLAVSPVYLHVYAIWVLITRLLLSLGLYGIRRRIHGLFPLLLYYNQVYGSFLKTYVLFRLDRQRWTRQNIALAPAERWLRWSSAVAHALALAALVVMVGFLTELLLLPPVWSVAP